MSEINRNFGLLVGDNIFSFILSRRILNKKNLRVVIVSCKNTNSLRSIISIYRKTSFVYFLYRSLIQIFSKFYFRYSILNYAKKNNIPLIKVANSNELNNININCGLFFTVNFDLILKQEFINRYQFGVINVHASDLPKDKGISPAVWAYCRGDDKIFISYYKMNGNIDSGRLLKKEYIKIESSWSLFRTYCEVLEQASFQLEKFLDNYDSLYSSGDSIDSLGDETYNSWPNKSLHKCMRSLGRKYFNWSDFYFLKSTLYKNKK